MSNPNRGLPGSAGNQALYARRWNVMDLLGWLVPVQVSETAAELDGAACLGAMHRRCLRRSQVAVVTWLASTCLLSTVASGTDAVVLAAPFALLPLVAWAASSPSPSHGAPGLVRTSWPLMAWPFIYDGTVALVEEQPPARFVDGWLMGVDALLLGAAPPDWPLGGPVEELANLFYTSYYFVVPAGFLWIWCRREEADSVRYGVALLASLTACAVVWLALPSGGWHPSGSPDAPAWGPFTAFARWIYASNPHYAAAFPSSHVAVAVACTAVLRGVGVRAWIWVWPMGIGVATVYGQYHYALDAVAGGWVGWAAGHYALGPASTPLKRLGAVLARWT